ncbi:MAG: hemerythrin family protein [Proteobacteria bacterium]|nr:hemerythrin family protein [Pseudomonadota bacterium]
MGIIGSGNLTEKIYWTPAMSVGVERIDYQHKELFCLVNDLMDLVGEGKDSESFTVAFKFLEGYVVNHFGEEEKYMELFSYPGIKEHKEQHEMFKKTLDNMKERFDEFGATTIFLKILQSQLAAWIMTHVKNVDKKFGVFLKDKDIESV